MDGFPETASAAVAGSTIAMSPRIFLHKYHIRWNYTMHPLRIYAQCSNFALHMCTTAQ